MAKATCTCKMCFHWQEKKLEYHTVWKIDKKVDKEVEEEHSADVSHKDFNNGESQSR